MQSGLKILFVSAEVSPFAKTGGLADVAGSLPQAVAAKGNDVRVVMPRYQSIKNEMKYVADFPVYIGQKKETCILRQTDVSYGSGEHTGKVPVYFVDSYHYFDREGIYCHFDDADRFAFFCMAVLEMIPKIGFQPDIIHCNDWHTGPICMLLKEKYRQNEFYKNISTVYTIHNLEYQGHFSRDTLGLFNLETDVFTPDKVEFYGVFNFMKAGLVYADIINTVSDTYAREIQTERYGERLEGLLKTRSEDLFGVVNGISYEEFNPSADPRIYKNFSFDNFEDKIQNKYALQKEMGLPVGDVPLYGLISRLAGQKGLDLIMEIADQFLEEDVQFVLLGMGDPYYENAFKDLKVKYPGKVAVYIGFNAALAQRIYAGSDLFLMPSRFEPCGLGQIISLRYGTIPIVRATGGLADTIIDYDADPVNGNGFSFEEFSAVELQKTIDRSLRLYRKTDDWKALVRKALTLDFSWNRPADKYIDLYKRAIKK